MTSLVSSAIGGETSVAVGGFGGALTEAAAAGGISSSGLTSALGSIGTAVEGLAANGATASASAVTSTAGTAIEGISIFTKMGIGLSSMVQGVSQWGITATISSALGVSATAVAPVLLGAIAVAATGLIVYGGYKLANVLAERQAGKDRDIEDAERMRKLEKAKIQEEAKAINENTGNDILLDVPDNLENVKVEVKSLKVK